MDAVTLGVANAVAARRLPRTARPPMTAVLFGDSITDRNGLGDTARSGETTIYNDSRGWFHWANCLLGRPFTMVKNAGKGGDTTTQMLARITDVTGVSPTPGWLFGLAGINDESALDPATSIANLKAIFTAAFAAGYSRIVWGTTTPDTGNTGQRWVIDQINAWLKAYARQTPGFILVNWSNYFLDGAATGNPISGYTVDGLHPSPLGAAVMGQALADVLRRHVPDVDSLPMSNTSTAVSTNPMLTGTTAGKASGFTATGFSTYKMARYDGRAGEWQVLVSAATGGATFFQDVAVSGGTFAAGDTLFAELEFETDDDWVTPSKFSLSLFFVSNDSGINSVVNNAVDMMQVAGMPALGVNPRRGVLRTPNIVVPAQVTTANAAKLRIILDTDFIGTVRIGRFGCYKKVTP